MELVDNALIKSPDNHSYLHCKGWGLNKQGKYQEALKILQKSWDIRREKAIYTLLNGYISKSREGYPGYGNITYLRGIISQPTS